MAAIAVLRSHDFFSLMGAFQDGIYFDLRERFRERYSTNIPSSRASQVHTLPPTFRDIPELDPPREIDMNKLFLTIYHRDRRFPLHLAIVEGNLPLVQRILHCVPELLSLDALYCATKWLQIDIVQALLPHMHQLPNEPINPSVDGRALINLAARVNCLPLVKFFYDQLFGNEADDTKARAAIDSAAAHGNLEMVSFLHKRLSDGCSLSAVIAAIQGGHPSVLAYLVDHFINHFRDPMAIVHIFKAAGTCGDLAIVEHICLAYPDDSSTPMAEAAAIHDHVHVLEWLRLNRGERGSLLLWEGIVQAGHVDVLKWLVEIQGWSASQNIVTTTRGDHYGPPLPGFVQMPVKVNRVELVEFLHGLGHPLDNIYPMALPVLEFMHKVAGMPLTRDYVYVAVGGSFIRGVDLNGMNGHLNQVTKKIDGHLDIVKYIHAQPDSESLFSIDDMAFASAMGSLEIVQFLHENRHEGCTTEAMDAACTNGHVDIVKYLMEHREERCSSEALSLAIYNGHLDVVKFLLENIHDIEWDAIADEYDDKPLDGIHADLLEYLIAHGAASNVQYEVLFDEAVQCGRLDLVAAVASWGLPLYIKYRVGLVTAMTNDDARMVALIWRLAKPVWSDFDRQMQARYVARFMESPSDFSGPWDVVRAELEAFQC